MKTKNTKSLPDKPSKLIRVALADLAKCERSKLYKIDMHHWHTPNGKCKVCFAGSVMAQSLGCPRHKLLVPDDFDADTENKLGALDDFRIGEVHVALRALELPTDGLPEYRDIASYGAEPQRFKRDMLKLAKDLAEHGL